MQKWLIFLMPFVLIAATNSNSGNSLYGSSTQNQTNTSHLTQAEQNFANQLSPIHRNVFVNQFTPQQRSNAMALTNAKDPLNTEPGPVSPDHSIEIIMQGARDTQTSQQDQNSQQQNGMQNSQQQNGAQNGQQQNGMQNSQQQNGAQNGQQQNGMQNSQQQNGSQNNQQFQSQMPQQYQPQQQLPYDQRQLPDGCKRY